ncbi:MAG: hypothetical protein HC772_00805 [Leptolyngbyaceae cyanobacterium CRU_2_3]|nr:hypothetical protein [Leptolyngbyaceae cyanobacterium CRU_2_3]
MTILSGDIHYGSAVRMDYESRSKFQPLADLSASRSALPKVLIQMTSSALKNSELKTCIIHTKLKSLLPETPEEWIGWDQPSDLTEPSGQLQGNVLSEKLQRQAIKRPTSALKRFISSLWTAIGQYSAADISPEPDWHYQIQWLKRQPAQGVAWGQNVHWLKLRRSRLKAIAGLVWCIKLLWLNRWLQDGKEVVGRNNLGVITFKGWTQLAHPVVQDLYWYAPWKPNSIVFSRFSASLNTEEKQQQHPSIHES